MTKKAKKKALQRDSVFQPEFLEDLWYWIKADRRVALKIMDLVNAVLKEPFEGIGKPEPLKYLGPGVWSRRITQEHRMVYFISDDRVDFLQCRYHY